MKKQKLLITLLLAAICGCDDNKSRQLNEIEYDVIVDYRLRLSDAIRAAYYDWKPDQLPETAPDYGANKDVVTLLLIPAGATVPAWKTETTTPLVREYFADNKLRPATHQELLAFSAAFPRNPNIKRCVVALGSFFGEDDDGRRNLMVVVDYENERNLDMAPEFMTWRIDPKKGFDYYFLAMRK